MSLLAPLLLVWIAQPDAKSREMLKYVSIANQANIERFTHGRVEFELLRSERAGAGTIKDTMPQDAVVAKGMLVFDNINALYTLSYEDDYLVSGLELKGDRQYILPALNTTLLTDGKSTLLNLSKFDFQRRILADNPEVYPESNYEMFQSYANFIYPVTTHHFTTSLLSNDLRDVSNGVASLESVRIESENGPAKLLHLSLIKPPGVRRDYLVDLNKGSVPLTILEYGPDGALMSERLYGELRKVADAWFPFVSRVNQTRAGISQMLVVRSADFISPVGENEFVVKFREPVEFTDRVTSTLQREASYSLIQRSRRPLKGTKKVTFVANPTFDLTGERELPPPKYWRYGVIALVLVGGLIIWITMYTRKRGT
jgi:hypothetical protein